MLKIIKKNKYFIFTFISFLSVSLMYLNLQFWHSTLLGILFFAVYLIINVIWLNRILSKFISFNFNNVSGDLDDRTNLQILYSYLLSVYCLLILLAFAGAIFIVLWKITPVIMTSILLGLTLIISTLNQLTINSQRLTVNSQQPTINDRQSTANNQRSTVNSQQKQTKRPRLKVFLCFYVFMFLCLLCLLFLWKARTGDYILSPWEKIHPIYLYLWFFITFVVSYLVFYRNPCCYSSSINKVPRGSTRIYAELSRPKFILLIIILHSFLLHAYLPMVYKTGFGGDRWRHVAAERYLQQGKIYSPALFGEEVKWQKFGSIKIPSVFIVGNKTSYANQWALTSFLSWILNIDVFWVDIFLLPILWSIFLPLFLFGIGQLLIENLIRHWKFGSFIRNWKLEIRNFQFPLLLAFLPNLFYPFQVYGSITIPTAFGFLLFLFLLILFFNFLNNQSKKSFCFYVFMLLCFFLLYFSYALYLILFLEISLIYLLFKKLRNKKLRVACYVLCVLCFLFLIPSLDTAYSLTEWDTKLLSQPITILSSLGEFIQKLLGFENFVLLPTHITQGNFIYMQTAKSLSSNTLLSLVHWPIIISSIIWGFIIYGIFKMFKQFRRRPACLRVSEGKSGRSNSHQIGARFARALSSFGPHLLTKVWGRIGVMRLSQSHTFRRKVWSESVFLNTFRYENKNADLCNPIGRFWDIPFCHCEERLWERRSLPARSRSFASAKTSNPVEILRDNPRLDKQSNLTALLLIFLIITLGNQFISNYFMQGVHILSKRLDLTIAFLMLPFLGIGIYKFINSTSRLMTRKAKVILICLFLALASTSTYASGPKLEVVTEDELKAAQYIWNQMSDVRCQMSDVRCQMSKDVF